MEPATLMILGAVIGFIAFGFAALNMKNSVTSFWDKGDFNFSKTVSGHFGAMIGMAFGGLLFAVGLIWQVVVLIK